MKNRTLGSILLVAGTTIGAGMLAMPLVGAGVGFSVTLLLLLLLWLLMCYTALLLLEAYQHQPADTGLGTLARHYLGVPGQWLTSFSMLFLMYALTAAYISGAGELLTSSLSRLYAQALPAWAGTLLFTLVAGGIVCIGTHSIDLLNRILFSAKILFLILVLALMVPHIEKNNLTSLPVENGVVLAAIPVMFTAFGFHGSIPSVIRYMGGNIHRLRWVFIIGSAIPLLAYILWQLSALGSIPTATFASIIATHTGLNGLLQAVSHMLSSHYVEQIVQLFAALALATSFFGVSLGLFDYLADLLKRTNTTQGRLQTGLITFLPPLFFALFYPQGFVMVLGFAAVALAVLALFLPALLALQTRKIHQRRYQVWGGKPALILVLICGILVITIQTGITIGLLPFA